MSLKLRSAVERPQSAAAILLNSLSSIYDNQAAFDSGVASVAFAKESVSQERQEAFDNMAGSMTAMLAEVMQSLDHGDGGIDAGQRHYTVAQESAFAYGASIGAGLSEFIRQDIQFPTEATRSVIPMPGNGHSDYVGKRTERALAIAKEAFDNLRETRAATLYTAAYNYTLSRQDEFGETVWPTLTLPNDQIGFGILVNRLTIHRGVTHGTDGKPVEFKKVDLARAEANHEILRRERTRVYPIVRANNAAFFIDPALVAPADRDVEGTVISTAPLRTGVEVGLLGISQTDASLAGGLNNQTDTLDPAIQVEAIYVNFGGDAIKFNIYSHASSNFVQAPQGKDKQRNLNFRNKLLTIRPETLRADGTDLDALAIIKTKNLTVTLDIAISGDSNPEIGSAVVYHNSVRLSRVTNEDGESLAVTDPDYVTLQNIIDADTTRVAGWDPRAWRTNINMRERGDFIDSSHFTQLYEIPLLSPVTAQRPIQSDNRSDTSDFEALVAHTRYRLKNDAVTSIFESCNAIADAAGTQADPEELFSQLGAARFAVLPVFYGPPAYDISTLVNTPNSSDIARSLQEAVINLCREYAFQMYVNSEYQAGATMLGQNFIPTVIIATSPYIRRWLTLDGELRPLTEKFQVRIVDTLDRRFADKLFMTFGVFDENRNTAPNILNWGNLIWAPESVMSATVPRGESMSRETIVQPRYRFVNHLPIATMLTLTGFSQLVTESNALRVFRTNP